MEKELKNKERHIGYEVRTLDNMIGRRVNCWHSKMDEEVGITRMQAWIIGYVGSDRKKALSGGCQTEKTGTDCKSREVSAWDHA